MTEAHDQLHDDIARVQHTVDQIASAQSRQGERLGTLETWRTGIDVVLFGDKRSNGVGLVQQSRGQQEMLHEWRQLKKALYWTSTVVGSVVAGLLLYVVTGV